MPFNIFIYLQVDNSSFGQQILLSNDHGRTREIRLRRTRRKYDLSVRGAQLNNQRATIYNFTQHAYSVKMMQQ